jgi:hypothetical protein
MEIELECKSYTSEELIFNFTTHNVDIWLDLSFQYNPFVNLFLIIESFFALCPSDNFALQEQLISSLVEFKIKNLHNNRPAPCSGKLITLRDYMLSIDLSELYCLHFLVAVKIDCRRKLRFIRITDCYLISNLTMMKGLFDKVYLVESKQYSPSILEENTLNLTRKHFAILSSDYGAKYKQVLKLSFVLVKFITPLEQLINTSCAIFLQNNVRYTYSIHIMPLIYFLTICQRR